MKVKFSTQQAEKLKLLKNVIAISIMLCFFMAKLQDRLTFQIEI